MAAGCKLILLFLTSAAILLSFCPEVTYALKCLTCGAPTDNQAKCGAGDLSFSKTCGPKEFSCFQGTGFFGKKNNVQFTLRKCDSSNISRGCIPPIDTDKAIVTLCGCKEDNCNRRKHEEACTGNRCLPSTPIQLGPDIESGTSSLGIRGVSLFEFLLVAVAARSVVCFI